MKPRNAILLTLSILLSCAAAVAGDFNARQGGVTMAGTNLVVPGYSTLEGGGALTGNFGVAGVLSSTSFGTLADRWDATGLISPAVNGAATETRGDPLVHIQAFDATTIESLSGRLAVPDLWAGTAATVTVWWAADTATTDQVVWRFRIMDTGDQDLDSLTYDDWIPMEPVTCSGTAGVCVTSTTGYQLAAALDGLSAGDPYQFEIARNATHPDDDMTGDAHLLRVRITWH